MVRKRLDSLDGLRGVAACAVLVHHMYQQYYLAVTGIHYQFFDWLGTWGVSVFFVLSGFCIHYPQALKRRQGVKNLNYRRFALNRMLRIVPAYYFALLICLLAGRFVETNLISKSASFGDIVGHLLFLHDTFPSGLHSINAVFWTIAVEMQFYIIYASIYKFIKFNLNWLVVFFIIGITWYGIFSALLSSDDQWRVIFQTLPVVTFWSWYLGALIAKWTVEGKILADLGCNNRFYYIFVIIVIAANFVICIGDPTLFRLHLKYWIVPFLCGLLILTLVTGELHNRFGIVLKGLRTLGLISYSLYLLHPVGILLALNCSWILGFTVNSMESQLMALFFSIALATGSYLFVEKPFLELKRRLGTIDSELVRKQSELLLVK
jgi:peptidoglycan/LPS O-acetylase OafA/YrhL